MLAPLQTHRSTLLRCPLTFPQAEPRHELVIVGAGMAALHLVERLPDSLLKVCCRCRLAARHALPSS